MLTCDVTMLPHDVTMLPHDVMVARDAVMLICDVMIDDVMTGHVWSTWGGGRGVVRERVRQVGPVGVI